MSIKKLLPVVLGAAVSMQVSAANTIEGSLSNDAVKVDVSSDQGTYFLDAGGMYHSDDGKYGYIGAHIEDKDLSQDYPVQIGIGGRLLAVDADLNGDDTGTAVGLGGFYRYTFPQANRFSVYGSAHYAPNVLSFQNIDNMYQAEIRGEYRTLRNALVFIRYGLTNVDLDSYSRDAEMNKSFGIGISATF
ncbi:YfaZ family outer membrane protein [Marinomonas ostreistagni]|uniref:YfaZ family outer membrane protein n=1 Tax=Marinomonas ostreistagni TaxID=359209 RepID=UPI001951B390|nr:YfaZ family outer membrane protein [Marinomonas ostreistagni]MBM6549923.1 hypothetical protein [Marinomonas ostreistagni]